MAEFIRVCPDCGDRKVYDPKTKPSRGPKPGTRCRGCTAKYARAVQLSTPIKWRPTAVEDGIVDEIVVERLTHGIPVVANSIEREEAVRILDRRGYSDFEIGRLLGGICGKTVRKIRARMDTAA